MRRYIAFLLVLVLVLVAFVAVSLELHAENTRSDEQGYQTVFIPYPADETSAEFLVPRVAADQTRPQLIASTEGDGDDQQEPAGPVGGSGNCIYNHKCSGGAICAQGSCQPSSGTKCDYCSGFACKDVQC
jgi:predicted outer membrane repeat protein